MSTPNYEAELKLLQAGATRIWRDDLRRLVMETQANRCERVTYEDVRPVRAFPLGNARRLIGITDADGKHIGLIKDLDDCDAQTRHLLEEELDKRYFIPTVTEVISFKIKMGVHSWEVVTDRGPRVFDVRERDDYRLVPPTRLLIRDVDGNRYEIPDYSALDVKTVDLIEQVL